MNLEKSLAHYEIGLKIGAGGMGEVYRARDSKLGRDVALKILPEEFAADQDRHTRFHREAQVLAAFSHPNVAAIHSLEEDRGRHFLVMELVEGEDLSARLERGPLQVAEALKIACHIAVALEAAHEKGIIHRDLKPQNVKIGTEDQIKVLDFGLAKIYDGNGNINASSGTFNSPTITPDMTQVGVIVGTAAYMSPEQARGRGVDKRADIFAFGAVLFEMLTGNRMFEGEAVSDTLAAVLKDDPDWSQLPPDVPPSVRRLLVRCLEKDPKQRLRDIGEARITIDAVQSGAAEEITSTQHPTPSSNKGVSRLVMAGLAVVALVAGTFLARTLWAPAGASGPETHARVLPLTFEQGMEFQPSLSPDGRSFVFVSRQEGDMDIFFQRVGGEKAINLTADSSEDDYQPTFSPDGELIAFRSDRDEGGIFLMGATGESVKRLTDFGFNPGWSPDGKELVFATSSIFIPTGREYISALWRVDVESGEQTKISEGDAVQPSWSPSGRWIAYWGLPEGTGKRTLFTIPHTGGDPVALTNDHYFNWSPVWSSDGSYLYFSSNRGGTMDLWRLPMDGSTGRSRGDPEPVTISSGWSAQSSLSRDSRRIIYTTSTSNAVVARLAVELDSRNIEFSPDILFRTFREIWSITLSPDGKWLALKAADPDEDLFVCAADGSGLRRLTSDPAKDREPRWALDSEKIFFFSDRTGRYEVWSIQRDGSGLQQITATEGRNVAVPVPSPDGTRLIVTGLEGPTSSGIIDLTKPLPTGEIEWLAPIDSTLSFWAAEWSPDGSQIGGIARPDGGTYIYSFQEKWYQKISDEELDGDWLDDHTLLVKSDSKIITIDIDTQEEREIYTIPEGREIGYWMLSHDRRWIYYIENNIESDIWMLELGEPEAL